MSDGAGFRNEASGEVRGTVVQAGSIGQLSLAGTATGTGGSVARQLPSVVRDFTGRTEQVAALDALLPAEAEPSSDGAVDDAGTGGSVVISAVDGAAGIGKTTLAVWWAHRVQHLFPDGTLHTNLRGYGPGDPASPGEVLVGFLRALGLPGERIPTGTAEKAATFRSLLAGRRVLMVLDNANAAEQVRPLLPGTAGCVVVVTSRDRLTGLVVTEGAARLTLDLLSEPEAITLASGIVGQDRATAEPDAVRELVRCCGRLPLAVRIAAGYASGPDTTVAEVIAEMADERYRLDVLSREGDERAAVRAVFDWSYQQLDDERARVFRRLGLHPGPEFCAEAAAAVTGLDLPGARRVLGALAAAHLIEPVRRGRYRLHDLLRAYASHRAETDDPPEHREQARERMWQWYAHHAKTAHQVLFPAHCGWRPALNLEVRADPRIEFPDAARAWAWIESEQDNLVAVARDTDRHGRIPLTILLATAAAGFLYRLGRKKRQLDLSRIALAAARRGGDRTVEAHALLDLGTTHWTVRQLREARSASLEGLGLARDLGNRELQAWALNDLGLVLLEQGQHAQARDRFLAALSLASGSQKGRLEGVVEGNLSDLCTGLGDYQQGLRHAERSLSLRRTAHDDQGEPFALHQIARTRQGLGDLREAIAQCENALAIEPHHRIPQDTAGILDTLGACLRDTGHIDRAKSCWRDALALYDQYGHPRADDLRTSLRALDTTRHP
ncbi:MULTISPECIES: ATP-binding protein [Amycolatopsis]|uniref:ATP-binding protein n=4 Tax=Amycolatopsis TaxID=1813 RepID=A0ABW5I1W4_9PSEU